MSLPRHSWKCHDPPPGPLTKCSITNDGEDADIPRNAAASLHVSREMRSTFISCIFNIRLYKRCRTEPGVYESIEQQRNGCWGTTPSTSQFLAAECKRSSTEGAFIFTCARPHCALNKSWDEFDSCVAVVRWGVKRNLSRRIPSSPMTLLIWEECPASFCSVRLFNNFPNLTSGEIDTKWVSL